MLIEVTLGYEPMTVSEVLAWCQDQMRQFRHLDEQKFTAGDVVILGSNSKQRHPAVRFTDFDDAFKIKITNGDLDIEASLVEIGFGQVPSRRHIDLALDAADKAGFVPADDQILKFIPKSHASVFGDPD